MANRYTAGDIVIGIIYSLKQSPEYPTGYKAELLVRDEILEFDTVKEVYDLQFSPAFFPYPCLGEINFNVSFDENGVITGMKAYDLYTEGCPVQTGMTIGTYAMFQKQITENTPLIRDILRIEDGRVVLHGYEKHRDDIVTVLHKGRIPELYDGFSYPLAPDAVVYTWDWSSAKQPFAKCTQEEFDKRGYVRHFSVGSLEDAAKNCYWINFYSTRGDESMFDVVKVFLNDVPGWE